MGHLWVEPLIESDLLETGESTQAPDLEQSEDKSESFPKGVKVKENLASTVHSRIWEQESCNHPTANSNVNQSPVVLPLTQSQVREAGMNKNKKAKGQSIIQTQPMSL